MKKRRENLLGLGLLPVVLWLIIGTTPILRSEPYIAVREGLKCAQCHVNKTGGGKRTKYGGIYSQTLLPMKVMTGSGQSALFDGNLNEFISVGGNFRVNDVTLFEQTSSTGEKAESSNDLQVANANVYLQVDLIKDFLTFYLDEIVYPTSMNREIFGMITSQDYSAYLKAGRMLLPYGLRLLDDDAFVRNRTGYTFNRHDVGVELGLMPGPYLALLNVTNNQLTLLGSVTYKRFRIGGSYGQSTVRGDDFVAGVFGGTNLGRLTFLGEIDFIREVEIDQLALLAEVNYLLKNGFNSKFTYEFFDRNRDVSNSRDGRERLTFGVEPFLTQFIQVGLFYRVNRFIPQNASQNQDQLTLQLHFFF
jgi:hypothetical protein